MVAKSFEDENVLTIGTGNYKASSLSRDPNALKFSEQVIIMPIFQIIKLHLQVLQGSLATALQL